MDARGTPPLSRRGAPPSSPKGSHCRRRRCASAISVPSPAVVTEALTSPPLSPRLRRRHARRPAISVTCGSMHRCGYTVLPLGSTKPREAVSLAVLAIVDVAAAGTSCPS